MYILGHRGYPKKYTENTLKSFKEAVRLGADGVELDVWKTEDDVLVISHDENLKRVFGVEIHIKKSLFNEIKSKASVPALFEVLEVLPKGKIINIELKDVEAGDSAVKLVRDYNLSEFVIFSSFEHELIKGLSKVYKGEKFGYLFDERHFNITMDTLEDLFSPEEIYSAHIPVELLHYNKDLFFKLADFFKRLHKKIVLWTVNDKDIINNIPVDYIITDEVEIMVNTFKHGLK
ncbi:glycerophosphodiester phosphodiesterase [Thermosipho ferrireducens]|uniref:Glycerophosphodiester phosphodiesterase n=1 Tax=Thermosipho ferrireducens TaxID=2571116 RepID=A0ABX7S8X6_9BACT|nr:glycerophosphodiester phosphodiesterase family protein [Thermosipho ferrireducens]QTA37771.1 glycerophosphodiester phosphodiesterase [Thermosipho ferrireducens]